MMAEEKVEVDLDKEVQEIVDKLAEDFLKELDMTPVYIHVDVPYAGFVEFGTGPARVGAGGGDYTYKDGVRMTKARKNIMEWVERKGRERVNQSGKSLEQAGKDLYAHIMTHGIDPHPFLRPALYNTMDSLPPTWLAEGHDMHDLAQEIVDSMKRILEEDRINDTRELSDSIRIETELRTTGTGFIPDDLWMSKNRGVNNKIAKVQR